MVQRNQAVCGNGRFRASLIGRVVVSTMTIVLLCVLSFSVLSLSPVTAQDGAADSFDVPGIDLAVETMLLDKDLEIADNNMRVSRIYAFADLYRASGGIFQSFSDLRIQNALASEVELDVWKKAVKEHFDRRVANLEGKMKVVDKYQDQNDQLLRVKRANRERVLTRMFDDPSITGKTETGINRLLLAFSNTPIGYGVGLDEYFATHPSHSRWDLTPEMLESIRVESESSGGGKLVFPLSDPVPLQFDWWPPVFRAKLFQAAIAELEQSRDALFAIGRQNPQLPIDAINALDIANVRLSQVFYSQFPHPWKNRSTEEMLELFEAERHLTALNKEIEVIRDRGTLNSMTQGQYFDPLRDGENAASLIAWMTRNGMNFAPPRPGQENAYAALLTKMKEMFLVFGEPLPDPDAPLPKTNPRRAQDVPRPQ